MITKRYCFRNVSWAATILVVEFLFPCAGAWIALSPMRKIATWQHATATIAPTSRKVPLYLSQGKNPMNDEASNQNPFDAFLSLVASEGFSISVGLLGLLLVVIHRLVGLDDSVADGLALETRIDLLAVFACGTVLLNGITELDVTTALAETVELEGTKLEAVEILQKEKNSRDWAWVLDSLLVATPATSAVILQKQGGDAWTIQARAGVLPKSTLGVPTSTPILDKVATPGNVKESYLPTLQALPGKREFPYFPGNLQLVLLIPMNDDNGVLILGSNRAKSFSPRDIAWCRIVAERL